MHCIGKISKYLAKVKASNINGAFAALQGSRALENPGPRTVNELI